MHMLGMRLLGGGVAALLLMTGCGDSGAGTSARVEVVASFYPLAFVAEEVGGSVVGVANLTPPGAEPHDLELTSGQVRALAEADLVLYIGGGFQPSIEDAVADRDTAARDVLVTQDDLLAAAPHVEEEQEGDEDEGEFDPHVWLDPVRTAAIAEFVADELAELDPDNASTYRSNAERLRDQLKALDHAFRTGLAECRHNVFVTSHEAFGYLARAYGLEEVGIAGIDPEAEPSPRRLAEIADFVREFNVTTIFFEVLVPPDIAETLAAEVGVETARLDPLEGRPESGDYFSGMTENLEALRRGLECT